MNIVELMVRAHRTTDLWSKISVGLILLCAMALILLFAYALYKSVRDNRNGR